VGSGLKKFADSTVAPEIDSLNPTAGESRDGCKIGGVFEVKKEIPI
jgi:hypothetical protein